MNKHFLCLVFPLLLAGCGTKTPVERITTGEPIKPVRMVADTTEIYTTDYLPLLMAQNGQVANLDWIASDRLEVILPDGTADLARNALPERMLLVNHDNNMQVLVVFDDKEGIVLPVLPNKPVKPALVSEKYEDGCLTVRFTEPVANPRFLVMLQNTNVDDDLWIANSDGSWTLRLGESHELGKCNKGRAFLRVYAEDDTYLYNDLLIPLQDGVPVTDVAQLNRHDDNAQVLYSLMIDRFENGNPANDRKLNSPEVLDIVDYQGGDFAGITKKINEGWFDELGITTIWISPITQNPWTAWGKYTFDQKPDGTYDNKFDPTKPYTRFSGYHGYWPIYITALEQRFGTEAEFKAMLDAAHAHNMNVVLDYVANHMHIESPTLQEHPTWHTDSILPDGRRNFELWDEARLTTWFDAHIPTLDLEREDVCQPMTDSALYWLANYDLDGFRHDACKHIPLNYWRMLGQKMAVRFPDRHIWMIGETYGDNQLIGSYVKTGMLPAQFDFNIYHTAIDVLGRPNQSMRRMAETIEASLASYGAHHTMGNISGNHDKCRFISLAGGAVRWDENDKRAGWTREVGLTAEDAGVSPAERSAREEAAYKAAMLLEVINLTIPGVPCIYQGDEYGQAGANDPDNRHMMRFDGLSDREQAFRNEVQELIRLRRNSMPLLYGDYIPVETTDSRLVFDRIYLGDRVRVTINLDSLSYTIE
ncbi:MAG: alpha-amylase family glycosyl hydrolase [Paludibacteraceae bacterium]